MADFNLSIPIILKHEGGFVNDPADPGGITKYGISLRFLQQNNIDLNGDNSIDSQDIIDLTVDQAKQLYDQYFWDLVKCDEVTDQDCATKIFDMAVNMSPNRATKIAQQAACDCGQNIAADGIIGPATLAAINNSDAKDLLVSMCRRQAGYYQALAQQRPSLAKFLNGWLKRAAWPFNQIP